jgi:hypothetical protein
MTAGSVFCVLAKPFDCVSHKILLGKLFYYGIHGDNIQWFKIYLAGRKQRDEISHNPQQKFIIMGNNMWSSSGIDFGTTIM